MENVRNGLVAILQNTILLDMFVVFQELYFCAFVPVYKFQLWQLSSQFCVIRQIKHLTEVWQQILHSQSVSRLECKHTLIGASGLSFKVSESRDN